MMIRWAFLVLVGCGVMLAFRPAWFLRGSGFLTVSSICALADSAVFSPPLASWAVFWVLPLALGIAGRRGAVIRSDIGPIVDQAARSLFLKHELSPKGFVVHTGNQKLLLRYRRLPGKYGILTFPHAAGSKKMALFKQVIYKKVPPLVPRIRIRTRQEER